MKRIDSKKFKFQPVTIRNLASSQLSQVGGGGGNPQTTAPKTQVCLGS